MKSDKARGHLGSMMIARLCKLFILTFAELWLPGGLT
jgi:hypothetical protein